MIDHEISAIFSDSSKDIFDDLLEKIKELDGSDDGLLTLFFSRYFEYKIITEVVYVIKKEGFYIFLEYPTSYIVNLDGELNPKTIEYGESQTFVKLMYTSDNCEYIDFITDYKGNSFNLFVFNDQDSISYGKFWIDNQKEIIEGIHVDDTLFMEVSEKYLTERIEKFKDKIQKVMDTGEAYEGINENPFSHVFYNAEDMANN